MRAIKSTKADTRRILRGQFYARGFPTNMSSRDLSLLMLTILHGASILKVICILLINYATAKARCGTRVVYPRRGYYSMAWAAREWRIRVCDATFKTHFPGASWVYFILRFSDDSSNLGCSCGVLPRWHACVSFNVTMLRLVSFSIDYHQECNWTDIADVRSRHSGS